MTEHQYGDDKPWHVMTEEYGYTTVAWLKEEDQRLVSAHWHALRHFVDTGDANPLRKFRGRTVGGYYKIPKYHLEVNTEVITNEYERNRGE